MATRRSIKSFEQLHRLIPALTTRLDERKALALLALVPVVDARLLSSHGGEGTRKRVSCLIRT